MWSSSGSFKSPEEVSAIREKLAAPPRSGLFASAVSAVSPSARKHEEKLTEIGKINDRNKVNMRAPGRQALVTFARSQTYFPECL